MFHDKSKSKLHNINILITNDYNKVRRGVTP